VPPSGIALIMGVDRILDMSRTAINVSGDLVAAAIMERWEAKQHAVRQEAAMPS
jgi:Na+/H+-dicarboxylate symporter